ncbi:hypothetical protein KC19_1G000200 [Ceratodon purpureus]|uniref:Uncharacterized protein n=1 Tax=Ceratodon purpureus TaxID=3225 RepID=A0A8T0J0N2_CERPU|nr:hypothetical protein KC19_11G000100 [Ceratodon purpureus]KAG0589165.1 hypothetical protein KC19_1G000200 [Ceratodon purpureus]
MTQYHPAHRGPRRITTQPHGVWTRHELHRGPPRNNKHVGHMHAVPRGTTLTAGSTPSPQHPPGRSSPSHRCQTPSPALP